MTILTENYQKLTTDVTRIANSLERIAAALEHLHIEQIDNIDHNHVEGDINNHPKTW
tara:strand:- start:401 stop:571 length:171 start_codon:yes stop_codon:yes gene_type:complete